MKDKPIKERLVPGLSLQIQRRNDWWFDFNPYMGYRFTGRITGGLGWNQRIAYDFKSNEFNKSSRIYGLRTYGEYRLKKGIAPRVEVEVMNSPIRTPPDFSYSTRDWVWSAMVGLKKEYKISKKLRGNAQVLYNVFDAHHKSPYTDRVNIRTGVELQMKKKTIKKS